MSPERILVQCRGDRVGDEHPAGGVEVGRDVVGEQLLDELLARLRVVLGDLRERLVGGGEDGVVGRRAVQDRDQIRVLVDEARQLGGVLAPGNQLVERLVGLAVAVMRLAVLGRPVVRRRMGLVVWVIEDVVAIFGLRDRRSRVDPRSSIEFGHRAVALERALGLLGRLGRSIDGMVDGVLAKRNAVFEGLFHAGPDVLDVAGHPVEEGLGRRLGLDDLRGELFVGDDIRSRESRERQDSSCELHDA